MELIDEVIEKSWYKFNMKLTYACIQIIKKLRKINLPESQRRGFNRCWLFMQLIYGTNQQTKMGLSYYWFKEGVVVDPETLMLVTHGRILFKWEPDCPGCQIETECPCKGNPNNNEYAAVEEKLKQLR